MKTPRTLFAALAIAISLTACTFTTTRTNNKKDRDTAEKVINKLFDLLKAKKYDATYDLFSDSLLKYTPKEKLKLLFTDTDDKLGDIQSDSLANWNTRVVSGTTNSAEYQLNYKNRYQKGTAEVDIVLTLEKGKIKILGYHILRTSF